MANNMAINLNMFGTLVECGVVGDKYHYLIIAMHYYDSLH